MTDRLQEVLIDDVSVITVETGTNDMDELILFTSLKRALELLQTQFLPWLYEHKNLVKQTRHTLPPNFYFRARAEMSKTGHIYAKTQKEYQAINGPSAIQQSWFLFYQSKFTKLLTQASFLLHGIEHTVHERHIVSLKLLEPDMETTLDNLQHTSLTQQDFEVMSRRTLMGEPIKQIVCELKERQTHIQQLEVGAQEVFELFQDLAVLVNVQQEQLDNIDLHIRAAKNQVQSAEGELQQAVHYQQASSRKKKVCCFMMLALSCIFVVIGFSIMNAM